MTYLGRFWTGGRSTSGQLEEVLEATGVGADPCVIHVRRKV